MITPEEVRETSFQIDRKGYCTNHVDEFLGKISQEIETIMSDNASLKTENMDLKTKLEDAHKADMEVNTSIETLNKQKTELENLIAEKEATNKSLLQENSKLTEEIEKRRKDEDFVKSALINAEKTAQSVINESKEKAKAIVEDAKQRISNIDVQINAKMQETDETCKQVLADANDKREQIIRDSENDVVTAKRELENTKRSISIYKQKIAELYNTYIAPFIDEA